MSTFQNYPSVRQLVPSTPLTTAAVLLYTYAGVPNGSSYLRGASFSNWTGGALTYSMYVLPSGIAVVAAGYLRYGTIAIPASTTHDMSWDDWEFPIPNGASIWCLASANNSINFSLSGAEQA